MKEQLRKALTSSLKENASIPFWSWNNALDEKVLVRQIEEMKSVGIGGFIMHARTGLMEEYLGEKWFSCIEACLKKAKELDMEAWVYDENGWPSGFVGGKLLENEAYRARFLEYAVGAFDGEAFACFVPDEVAGFLRVESPVEGVNEYHNVYLRVSPANTDILNPEVVDAFIEETHEQYYSRFAESFGRELAGFFTDEPQFYRWATPYSLMAKGEFERLGEDVRDGLVWLFVQDTRGYEFRTKYYAIHNRLYVENFYKKLYDWCQAHNCKLTGHSIEESALYAQMWGGGAVMPTYEYEDIPAIDWLGRTCGNELSPKQVGSVASQLNKKLVLTETFACCGYDVTPKELKSVGEFQYFNGVNKLCYHLYPYSLAGRGKSDHPPVFGPHSNWFKEFKTFNEYFSRLGYLISNTEERVDIAIVHPIRDIWLDYTRAGEESSVIEAENAMKDLLTALRKRGVTFHLIDEGILARHGSVEEGTLRVGCRRYQTVLVPRVKSLAESTYRLLKAFEGKLCTLSEPSYLDGVPANVSLEGNCSFEEIVAGAQVKYACEDGNTFLTSRAGELGEFLFLKNLSEKESSTVTLKGVAEEYVALDLETLTERVISNTVVLDRCESLILVKDKSARDTAEEEQTCDCTSAFRVENVSENYFFNDLAQLSKDGKSFGERRPVTQLFEELLREDYKGKITVRQTFALREVMPLTLILERAKYESVLVNGNAVAFTDSAFDVNFTEANISDCVKVGENEVVYTLDFWQHDGVHFALFDPLATESLRNCLYYDVSLEPSYVKGNFTVNDDFSLSARKRFPTVGTDLYRQGYPFFMGDLTLKGKINVKKKGRQILRLDGRFVVAELTVNGKQTALTLDFKRDITDLLQEGENDVTIVLKSSLRNAFGPHHFKPEPEPLCVSPYHFEFRGEWNGDLPADFTPEYNFVPFGVDQISLITVTEK